MERERETERDVWWTCSNMSVSEYQTLHDLMDCYWIKDISLIVYTPSLNDIFLRNPETPEGVRISMLNFFLWCPKFERAQKFGCVVKKYNLGRETLG